MGGTQARESRESCSSSSCAVGLFDLVALQHDCTNSQRVSEKPKDSAFEGFSGRVPLSAAGSINVIPRIRWNGLRPVKTWDA